MKSLTKIIISIIFLFSIVNTTVASQDYIEKAFNFDSWVEQLNLQLSTLDKYSFKTQKLTTLYYQIKRADDYMNTSIIEKYNSWEFGYYQTNWIIKNYNTFIYHVNQFFYYMWEKEKNPAYIVWYDDEIMKQYKSMKIYYAKVKTLTNKRGMN